MCRNSVSISSLVKQCVYQKVNKVVIEPRFSPDFIQKFDGLDLRKAFDRYEYKEELGDVPRKVALLRESLALLKKTKFN